MPLTFPHELARPAASLDPVKPEPLVIAWHATQVRIRHDDSRLTPCSPGVARLRSAVELARDLEGLRLVLEPTMGERYRVRVRDDGAVVGLWRRQNGVSVDIPYCIGARKPHHLALAVASSGRCRSLRCRRGGGGGT